MEERLVGAEGRTGLPWIKSRRCWQNAWPALGYCTSAWHKKGMKDGVFEFGVGLGTCPFQIRAVDCRSVAWRVRPRTLSCG